MSTVPKVNSETNLSDVSQASLYEETPREIFFKFILVGEPGYLHSVGKTSILQRYIENTFNPTYNVTVGVEFGSKQVDVDEYSQIKLQIWDTAGQQSFINIVRSFYNGSKGVFFVYNINKKETFVNLEKWKEEVFENVDPNAILILMGNQADVKEREVSYDEGVEFMQKHGMHFFFETSAQDGTNIDMAFTEAGRLAFISYLKERRTGKGDVLDSKKDVVSLATPKVGTVKKDFPVVENNKCAC